MIFSKNLCWWNIHFNFSNHDLKVQTEPGKWTTFLCWQELHCNWYYLWCFKRKKAKIRYEKRKGASACPFLLTQVSKKSIKCIINVLQHMCASFWSKLGQNPGEIAIANLFQCVLATIKAVWQNCTYMFCSFMQKLNMHRLTMQVHQ